MQQVSLFGDGVPATKKCGKCQQSLPLNRFSLARKNKGGRHHYCRDCARAVQNEWRKANSDRHARYAMNWQKSLTPEQSRHRFLSGKYGITKDQYDSMAAAQKNLCAICGCKPEEMDGRWKRFLNVDHCHRTGKVRGLLCNKCNKGIGHFRDSPSLMDNAIRYLEESGPVCSEFMLWA